MSNLNNVRNNVRSFPAPVALPTASSHTASIAAFLNAELTRMEAEARAEIQKELDAAREENAYLRALAESRGQKAADAYTTAHTDAQASTGTRVKKTVYTKENLLKAIDKDMRNGRTELRLERCIMRLFYMQNEAEQIAGKTLEKNDAGVQRQDAGALTLMGAWILGHRGAQRRLTGKWVVIGMDMVAKYSRQLCAYANASNHGLCIRFED